MAAKSECRSFDTYFQEYIVAIRSLILKCIFYCTTFNDLLDSLGIVALFYYECAAIRVPIAGSERKAVSDELRRHRSRTQLLQCDFDGQW